VTGASEEAAFVTGEALAGAAWAGDFFVGDFFVGDFLGAAFLAVLEALADFFPGAFVVDDVDAAVFFRTPLAAGESVTGDFSVADFFAAGVVGEEAAAFFGVGVVLPVGLWLLATVLPPWVAAFACVAAPSWTQPAVPGLTCGCRSARSARSAVTEVPGRRTTGGG
jgi:hypothetical protein